MRELAARKRTIEQVLQDLTIITPKTSRSIILHAQAMKVQGIVPPPSSLGTEQRVNEEAWNRYLDQLREELPTIEPELKQLQMEYEDRLVETENLLDYYLDKPE